MMAATRPTAVNLFWAIDRMKAAFAAAVQAGASAEEIADRPEREARAIHDEDVANCRLMGGVGAEVVPDGGRVLTHCNAGRWRRRVWLGARRYPCGGGAGEEGRGVCDETRPFMQGASDGVGTDPRRHQHHRHHGKHGRPADARGGNRSRDRRGGSNRSERRHGQQDRHLHRRRAGARASHSALRRGASVHDRSHDAGWRGDSY